MLFLHAKCKRTAHKTNIDSHFRLYSAKYTIIYKLADKTIHFTQTTTIPPKESNNVLADEMACESVP